MVHLRSKALERTILKICFDVSEGLHKEEKEGFGGCTFCTLMLWLVLLKIRLARMAFANRRACTT